MTTVLLVGAAFGLLTLGLLAATALHDGVEALARRWRS